MESDFARRSLPGALARLDGCIQAMKTSRLQATVALFLLCLSSGVFADKGQANDRRACREQPGLAGACYSVRGRLNLYNGSPGVRIWVVGTRRVLGVIDHGCEGEGCSLPDEIVSRVSMDTNLFGDFVVCPFTADRPGVMRSVCVDSGTNLDPRPRGQTTK